MTLDDSPLLLPSTLLPPPLHPSTCAHTPHKNEYMTLHHHHHHHHLCYAVRQTRARVESNVEHFVDISKTQIERVAGEKDGGKRKMAGMGEGVLGREDGERRGGACGEREAGGGEAGGESVHEQRSNW